MLLHIISVLCSKIVRPGNEFRSGRPRLSTVAMNLAQCDKYAEEVSQSTVGLEAYLTSGSSKYEKGSVSHIFTKILL